MIQGTRFVACPHCGAQIAWVQENRYRPFCSERCKMIDLGAWAEEEYRIPAQKEGNIKPDDEE